MNNPFFRAKTAQGKNIDINLNAVASFEPSTTGEGTRISFINGSELDIDLSPAAVRGRTRKAWPGEQEISGTAGDPQLTPQQA
jgi:hypothetical protein